MPSWLFLVLIFVFILVLLFVLFRKRFIMPLNNITMFNGGVGSGKTTISVFKAISCYKKEVRIWKLKKFFHLTRLKKPCLYSNIPIKKIPYVPLTANLIYGDTNFSPKCSVLWSEVSISASSMDYNKIDYEKFSLGIKLFRHRTLGGHMFVDTQAVSDMHYVLKRSINSYIWIERFIKLPFLLVYKVRNMMLVDENSINVNRDTQTETRYLIVPKRVWKYFDSYNFYGLYQNTKVDNKVIIKNNNLRSYDYIRLNRKEVKK